MYEEGARIGSTLDVVLRTTGEILRNSAKLDKL